jgi:hypothetical protein
MMHPKALPLKIVMLVLIVMLVGATFTSVLAQREIAHNAGATCERLDYGVTVPHDVLSGLPRATCDQPVGIISPRDEASGLPTGK